jgi:hypothetical protein
VRTRRVLWPRGAAIAAALLAAAVASGCGGGDQKDVNEPEGTFAVEVSKAKFPRLQGLGETAPFSVTVRNPGPETVPNVTMTVDGFANPDAVPGAADPQRPIWVVNVGPYGGKTAYVNTWALGPLKSGQSRTFTWSVTSTVPGTHTVAYRAAGGLNGNARAVAEGGGIPGGAVTVRVTRRTRSSTVNPETGAVEYGIE